MFTAMLEASRFPLTSDIADEVFGDKIFAESFRRDDTFSNTLRVLLHDRIKKDEGGINASFYDIMSTKTSTDTWNFEEENYDNRLIIFDVRPNGSAVITEEFDYLDRYFANIQKFKEIKDIALGFEQNRLGSARFFVDEAHHCTLVYVTRLDVRKWHLIQAFVVRLLPWFFPEKPTDPMELQLIQALSKQDGSEKYIEASNALSVFFDARKYAIRALVGEFEKKDLDRQIEDSKSIVGRIQNEMERLMESYSSAVGRLEQVNYKLLGLMTAKNSMSGSSELVEYFENNRELFPFSSDTGITFGVKTYLEYFNPDIASSLIRNKHSVLYSELERISSVPKVLREDHDLAVKFFQALFSEEPTLKIKMSSQYSINGGVVRVSRGFTCNDPAFADCVPNPHIYHYACLGNHAQHIQEALNRHDLIGAIAQCVASARSVNFGETPTIEYLVEDIARHGGKIFELEDGSSATLEEVAEWLKSKKEDEE